MQAPTKLLLTLLCLRGPIFFSSTLQAQPMRAVDRAAIQKSLLPNSVPEQRPLKLLSRFPLLVSGLTAGTVVVYDDPTTPRSADYFEVYDNDGDLVAAGWFDRFGIRRMAVDRGLVEEKGDLEGVFVTLLEGDSI